MVAVQVSKDSFGFRLRPISTTVMSGPSHIAGLDLAIPSARGFKGQSIANFDLVWINSCGLQVINVQKHIWAASEKSAQRQPMDLGQAGFCELSLRRTWNISEFRRCVVTPFGGNDMHLVTNLQKFAGLLECRLRAFPAMDQLDAILTIGLDGEAHFFFLRFFFRISAWARKASASVLISPEREASAV